MSERGFFPEEGIEVLHISTPDGCKVSLNGQGHFPCSIHNPESKVSSKMFDNFPDPQTEPQEYTSVPPETEQEESE